MATVECLVCLGEFSDDLIPKALECGHSLCSPCVLQLLERNRLCPQCKKQMTRDNLDEYPTNYALFSIISPQQKSKTKKAILDLKIETLNSRYEKKLKSLTEKQNLLKEKLDLLTESERSLTEEIDNTEKDLKLEELTKVVDELTEEFSEKEDDVFDSYKDFDFSKFKDTITMDTSKMDFLYKIYGSVSQGEKVFAISKVNDEKKFGRILTHSNKVLMYSLSEKPNEKEEQITAVKFEDLQRCMFTSKVAPFLNMSCNEKGLEIMMMIDLIDGPHLPQFIKRCTGEVGLSYKGSSCWQPPSQTVRKIGCLKRVPEINDFFGISNYLPEDKKSRQIDYIFGSTASITGEVGNIIVRPNTEAELGSFLVTKIKQPVNITAIGKINLSGDVIDNLFAKKMFKKVLDCGISLDLC